jgi:hypothetical protein
MTRREWLALGLVLALAGLLRLGWPSLTEFKRDEAHLYALALDVAELRAFPLRGISSSVGLPNPPINVYLFALPLFVWKSPLAATLFVGALNTASVGVGYWLARRYWGQRVALASALLYAAAPWAVIYSRKIWAQDLLPLFTVSYVAAGLLGLVEGRRGWLAAHLALLALVVQIHLSGAALAPLTLLLLVVYWRNVDRRELLIGLGLAALTALPIGLYALTRLGGLAGAAAWLGAHPAVVTLESFDLAWMVIQGTQVRGLAGPEAFRAFEATVPNFNPLLWLGGLLALAGLGLAAWRWWRARGAPRPLPVVAGAVVAVWALLPSLFFLRHATPVYPHYFISLFPAPYVLAGLAIEAVAARWRQAWVWALPIAMAASQAWLALALLRFVGTTHTPGAFGTPLGRLLEAAETARGLGEEVIVVAAGTDPVVDEAPAVFDVLLRGTPHRFVDGRTTAVFPAGEAAVLLWPGDSAWPATGLYRAWGGGEWAARLPLRTGEGEALIAAGGDAMPVPEPREASALLANGAEVLGTGLPPGMGGWALWWRAPGPTAGEAYHLFAHLLDANGARLAQVDAPTYPGEAWREGDLVVSVFDLPAGGAAVRVGMYAYPSLAPVPVLDAAGAPAGEWVEFPR